MSEPVLETAMTLCYFCNKGDRILINSTLTQRYADAVKECHNKVADMGPCNECEKLMEDRILLIEIDIDKCEHGWNKPPEGDNHWMPNPHRTGTVVWVNDRFIEDNMPSMADWCKKHRFSFVEQPIVKDIIEGYRKHHGEPETVGEEDENL